VPIALESQSDTVACRHVARHSRRRQSRQCFIPIGPRHC